MFADLSYFGIAIVVLIILVSITVHEAVHAFVAHALGDTTAKEDGRLSLNPLQHIDIFMTVLLPVVLLLLHLPPILIAKPVPFDPTRVKYGDFGAALMAIAGPFSNLVLAALAALILRATDGLGLLAVQEIGTLFIYINILFFVFNMIPFPPLDGSRLLFAFAPDALRRVMLQIESFGIMAIIIFVLLLLSFIGPVISGLTMDIYQFLLR